MIYTHIPFCEHKCPYCSFNSFVGFADSHEAYISALIRQFHHDRELLGGVVSESFYIGGGTPSCVSAAAYEPLFEAIKPHLAIGAEITIEANPNSLTDGWALALRKLGANRISIGVQSFDDDKLKLLGRLHNGKEAKAAIEAAKRAGFEQIGADLIYGVEGDHLELLKGDLAQAIALGATHISAYHLTIEENTPFAKRAYQAMDDRKTEQQFSLAIEAAGFPRYEVSSYGSHPSKHNLGYWALKPYLGLGAGAVGTVAHESGYLRYEPYKSVEAYIADPFAREIELIDSKTHDMEEVILGARCKIGFSHSALGKRALERAKILLVQGALRSEGDRFYNTDFWLSDEIWLFLNG
ncbi:coproporphyrinogen III oxidase [Campylobacterota bacterium]|nr:coproporphyrinogen III oxidase [Campylobacterota bacterium]